MEHLIVAVNLATLAVGLAVVVGLFRRWRADSSAKTFWPLVHFSGFTFTMVAAALDAYSVVNLGSGPLETRFWSALVLVGVAAMLFSFPHGARAQRGHPRPFRFSVFWAAAALVPLVAAALLVVLDSYEALLVVIAVAFVPFWAAVVYGLAQGARPRVGRRGAPWLVVLGLGAMAGGEVGWILIHPPVHGYFFVTLPLAYLYTCWSVWRALRATAGAKAAAPLSVPLAWVRERGLTEREREVAEGILRGLANKELAFELGLSENTVRNHIANLYRKLGIQKRLDLVLLVQRYQGEEPSN